MLPNQFGTRIISANAPRPFGTRIISANAPKSIWNTYSKRKCHAACRPASQPASQPASRHKNLDFRGCPGPLAKPTQIDPLGALFGLRRAISHFVSFWRPSLPSRKTHPNRPSGKTFGLWRANFNFDPFWRQSCLIQSQYVCLAAR